MSQIEVCGVTLSGSATPIDGLLYSRLIDWDGRPDARGGGDAIPGGQGVYARSDEFRESRLITVEAAIVAATDDEFFAVKRRVENMPMFGEMRVDQGDGVWSRQVEVERITIPDRRARTATAFTIDVVAPDPVRYREWLTAGPVGLPTQVGGLILPKAFPWDFGTSSREVATVTNDGSVPVLPRVTVTGSADALTVFGGARRLQFGAFDGVLVFDSLERRAFLNGADVTRFLVRRDWPVVDPGGVADFYFHADGASAEINLMVEYRIGAW